MRGRPTSTPAPDAPVLRVDLLGGFRVVLNGRAVPDGAWRRRKARQLFKCLLTRSRRRLTKDEAVELFWPESDVDASSTNLRTTVHAIRQALEAVGPPFVADLIVVDRDGIGVQRGADVWVDADAFEDAISRAQTAEDPAPLLEQADALYAGDYLPDDLYEDWAAERRDRLKRAWTELQFTLARLAEERGDPDRAATTLERLLQADSCDERTAQELMRLFARQGRRTEAVRVYQRLVQALRDELEVEPSAETVELHQQIAAPGARPAAAPADRPPPTVPPCSYPFPSPTRFVGRRDELTRLERIVERGRSGSQAVVITGPTGAGKSALLGAMVRRAERGGALCLAGAGYEGEGVVPFGPFHDALAGYLLGQPAEQAAAELGVSAPELALVVPELRYHLGLAEPPRLDDPANRPRLFAAIHAFLRGLAARLPVLLCLEDLHAAGAASLELFAYLARQTAHATRHLPLTLVGSYRLEGVSAGQPLSKLLAVLSHDRHVELIKLAPLDREGTAQMAAQLLEGPASPPLGDWLHATTEGNPLFLEQLVLALREEGRLIRRAGAWHEVADGARVIPTIIRELIGQRFERLTGRCRETLAAAAVLGQTIQHDVLLTVLAPREETSILEDLAEALDAQLLHEAPSGYLFAHALIRETIYWGQSAPRRMLLHARAGELLERRSQGWPGAADRAAELAHHFTLAGHSAPVRAKALRYSLEAGRTAAALSSYREAQVHFARACEVIEREGEPVDPALCLEALEGRGRAECELARWPESMTSFGQLLARSDDPVQRGRARSMLAYALLHTGDVPRALDECDAGLVELALVDGADAAAARLYLQYLSALVWYLRGRYLEVQRLASQMSSVAAGLGHPRSLFAAHNALAWAYMGQGKVPLALEEYARALAAAERGEDKIQVAIAHENLGYQSYLGGRLAAAREHLERALGLYRQSANELRAVNARQHLCRVWVAQGELARAREQASAAVDLEVEGQERWAADGHHILGVIDTQLADWSAATASFDQALGIRRRVGDMPGLVESLVGAGLVDQHLGRWSRAAAAYDEAVEHARAMDPGFMTVLARRHLGVLRLLMGDRAGAAEEIEPALALAETIPDSLEYAPTLLAMAALRLDGGDPAGALPYAERSLASGASVEHLLEARVMLARLGLALGQPAEAGAHAAEAVAQAERLGSPRLLSLAHLVAGRAAAAAGDPQAADASLELAIRQAEEAGTPYERALALGAAAERLAGRPSHRAAAMKAEALEILARLGVPAAGPAGQGAETRQALAP